MSALADVRRSPDTNGTAPTNAATTIAEALKRSCQGGAYHERARAVSEGPEQGKALDMVGMQQNGATAEGRIRASKSLLGIAFVPLLATGNPAMPYCAMFADAVGVASQLGYTIEELWENRLKDLVGYIEWQDRCAAGARATMLRNRIAAVAAERLRLCAEAAKLKTRLAQMEARFDTLSA